MRSPSTNFKNTVSSPFDKTCEKDLTAHNGHTNLSLRYRTQQQTTLTAKSPRTSITFFALHSSSLNGKDRFLPCFTFSGDRTSRKANQSITRETQLIKTTPMIFIEQKRLQKRNDSIHYPPRLRNVTDAQKHLELVVVERKRSLPAMLYLLRRQDLKNG